MSFRSWFLWRGEQLMSRILSRIFWPPTSAAVLAFKDDQLLAVKNGSYYMLPGGLLERGETFEDAARREAEEETGAAVVIGDRLSEQARDNMGIEVIFEAEVEDEPELEGSWEGQPEFLTVEDALGADWRFNRDIETLLRKAQRLD